MSKTEDKNSEIKFNDNKSILSQRTLAKILSTHQYKFIPITEYSNDLFYLTIRYEDKNTLQRQIYNIFKIKKLEPKPRYYYRRLKFQIEDIINEESENCYIVFDRIEIEKIIKDVPDNYIGGKVL